MGDSVTDNGTIENIDKLFQVGQEFKIPVLISPHYFYPHDHQWKFEGALEKLMDNFSMFDRKGALNVDGFEGSGADWLERYKQYNAGDNVVVTSPHKVYGPEPMIACCNCGKGASTKLSWLACQPIFAPSLTCGS